MLNPKTQLNGDFRADVERVSRIEAVSTILDVVCRITGMRFAAVARVTEDRWIACSVRDEIEFGLKPGGELRVETTICHQIRQSGDPVIIENVGEDADWCGHQTPAMYGFQSYISVPIVLVDGTFFGTLCAIDPLPARLKTPETIGMFRLFAELIAKNLEIERQLTVTESALLEERAMAELREQFIAVLGHDLRSPMRGIICFLDLLVKKLPLNEESAEIVRIIRTSGARMVALIDNLLDFARGRLGGGLVLARNASVPLEPVLRAVIAELSVSHSDRVVETDFELIEPIDCDRERIAQLFSNLLSNALSYGSADRPIRVRAGGVGGRLELSVANAGKPIPAAALERLFQPFHHAGSRRSQQGLGLGLYIAHEIAVAHGGSLGVTSTEGETRFAFVMPAV